MSCLWCEKRISGTIYVVDKESWCRQCLRTVRDKNIECQRTPNFKTFSLMCKYMVWRARSSTRSQDRLMALFECATIITKYPMWVGAHRIRKVFYERMSEGYGADTPLYKELGTQVSQLGSRDLCIIFCTLRRNNLPDDVIRKIAFYIF